MSALPIPPVSGVPFSVPGFEELPAWIPMTLPEPQGGPLDPTVPEEAFLSDMITALTREAYPQLVQPHLDTLNGAIAEFNLAAQLESKVGGKIGASLAKRPELLKAIQHARTACQIVESEIFQKAAALVGLVDAFREGIPLVSPLSQLVGSLPGMPPAKTLPGAPLAQATIEQLVGVLQGRTADVQGYLDQVMRSLQGFELLPKGISPMLAGATFRQLGNLIQGRDLEVHGYLNEVMRTLQGCQLIPGEIPASLAGDILGKVGALLSGQKLEIESILGETGNLLKGLAAQQFNVLRLRAARAIGFDGSPILATVLGRPLGITPDTAGLGPLRLLGGILHECGLEPLGSLLGFDRQGEAFDNHVDTLLARESSMLDRIGETLLGKAVWSNLNLQRILSHTFNELAKLIGLASGAPHFDPNGPVTRERITAYVHPEEETDFLGRTHKKVTLAVEGAAPDTGDTAPSPGTHPVARGVNATNTFRDPETFEYLDVGAWFGERLHVCLVNYGVGRKRADATRDSGYYDIAHCTWDDRGTPANPLPEGAAPLPPSPPSGNERIDALLFHDALAPHLRLVTRYRTWVDDGQVDPEPPTGRVYAFFGDMHIPFQVPGGRPHGAKGFPYAVLYGLRNRYDGADGFSHAAQWQTWKWFLDRATDFIDAIDPFQAMQGPAMLRLPLDESIRYTNLRRFAAQYAAADIFGNAGIPLADVLLRLRNADRSGALKGKIVLGQLGDMFDHWIGLRYLAQGDPTPADRVILADPSENMKSIRQWIAFSHKAATYPLYGRAVCVPHLFSGWPDDRRMMVYGNHENYFKLLRDAGTDTYAPLSVASVMEAVPEAERRRIPEGEWQKARAFVEGDPEGEQPLAVREDHLCAEGIWIEHGHSNDENNHDGCAPRAGPLLCNAAFVANGIARYADHLALDVSGWRYSIHIKDAVWRFIEGREGGKARFHVFAMAHTHMRYGASVRVVWLPEGALPPA